MEVIKTSFTPAGASPIQSRKQVQTVSTPFSEQLMAQAQANSAAATSGLPDSKGLTEENLAWLLEKYSDKEVISWDERAELFDTMRQLGILDNAQYDRAMAICPGMKVASASETTITTGPLLNDSSADGLWVISSGSWSIPVSFLEKLKDLQDSQEVQMWLDALEREENWSYAIEKTYYDSHGNLLGSTLH